MVKTIADRLRDYAQSPLSTSPWEFFDGASHEHSSLHMYFADEIEREYLRRPFIDGKPVQEGDFASSKYDGTPGKVRGVAVIDGKSSVLIERQGWYGEDEIEPAVLDANGVPYKVGETVHNVRTGLPGVVLKVLPKHSELGGDYVCIGSSMDAWVSIAYPADNFTHEKPVPDDGQVSLQGLLDYVNEQADKCDSRIESLNEIGRQLTILVERGE